MKILLTFTGFHDPYSKGLLGEVEQAGPILSLVKARSFDIVFLLSTPNTVEHTAATQATLSGQTEVREVFVQLQDPTDYGMILRALRSITSKVVEDYPGAEYFVSVASGTPQMHACWVLLVAAGEFPAHILHVRPPRFVTSDAPLVSEIDVGGEDFPTIRSRPIVPLPNIEPSPDLGHVINELGLVADHHKMLTAIRVAAALAPSPTPVLILGPTGTGKELVAKLIHRLSGRPQNSFVALNCAAIPKELADSVLFGHRKGSFTGAITDQLGKFEIADGGTLFLDELGELPLPTQAKLLRVLQDGFVEQIGAKKPKKVNVRVIGATNKHLHNAIRDREFREDLYFRCCRNTKDY